MKRKQYGLKRITALLLLLSFLFSVSPAFYADEAINALSLGEEIPFEPEIIETKAVETGIFETGTAELETVEQNDGALPASELPDSPAPNIEDLHNADPALQTEETEEESVPAEVSSKNVSLEVPSVWEEEENVSDTVPDETASETNNSVTDAGAMDFEDKAAATELLVTDESVLADAAEALDGDLLESSETDNALMLEDEPEEKEEDAVEQELLFVSDVCINPIYEGLIDESVLNRRPLLTAAPKTFLASGSDSGSDEEPIYYTQIEEAAYFLLPYIAVRATSGVTVNMELTSSSSESQPTLQSFNDRLMDTILPLMVQDPSVSDDTVFDFGGWGTLASSLPAEKNSDGTYTHKMKITLTLSWYLNSAQQNALTNEISTLFSNGSIVCGEPFETIESIYSYLASTVTYDNAHASSSTYTLKCTAYAALVQHTAVCQGIASAFYLLAKYAGISSRAVPSIPMNHAFNMVEIDGRWYYLDATWDLGRTYFRYYLKGTTNWSQGHKEGDFFTAGSRYYDPAACAYFRSDFDFTEYALAGVPDSIYYDNVSFAPSSGGFVYLDPSDVPDHCFTYSFALNSDGLSYPTGMRVLKVQKLNRNSPYRIDPLNALDDILQYDGTSIRCTGRQGMRIEYAMDDADRQALISGTLSGLEGYKLKEFGTVATWSNTNTLPTLDCTGAMSAYAFRGSYLDDELGMDDTETFWCYTNPLTFTSMDRTVPQLTIRPYMILENTGGEEFTVYGGPVTRSIAQIALQNRDTYSPGSGEHNFIWDIIRYAYPEYQ